MCVLLSQVTKRPVETLADAKLYAGHNLLFISSEESGDELFIQLLQQGEWTCHKMWHYSFKRLYKNVNQFGVTARSTCLLVRCQSQWGEWGRSWRYWPEIWKNGSSLRSCSSWAPARAPQPTAERKSAMQQKRTQPWMRSLYQTWAGRWVRGRRSHHPTQNHHLLGFNEPIKSCKGF